MLQAYDEDISGPWGSMIGAVVVTLTGLYWIFANTHLTKFSKETIMGWVGYQDPDEVMEIDNFGIYTG